MSQNIFWSSAEERAVLNDMQLIDSLNEYKNDDLLKKVSFCLLVYLLKKKHINILYDK